MTTKQTTTTASAQPPKIGQIITVRGKPCQIVRVHSFGTIDVCDLITGKASRVTGLPFISENDKTSINNLIRAGQLLEVLSSKKY